MSVFTPHRLASASGSAALAMGLLALVPAGPAGAATASADATYTCTTPAGQSFQLPASLSLADLPGALTAGVPVPAGVPITLDLDGSAIGNALGTTVLGGNYVVNQLSTQIGTTAVTNTVTIPLLTQLGTNLLGVGATLGSFTPQSSDLPVPVPTSFDLTGTVLGLPVAGSQIPCTLNPSAAGTGNATGFTGFSDASGQGLVVGKQTAKLRAHQVGHRAKVLVKVKNRTGQAAGKVVAKLHGKKIGKGTLRHGKVQLKLKRLHRGVNRVKVVYAGDAVSQAAHKTVRVRLVR